MREPRDDLETFSNIWRASRGHFERALHGATPRNQNTQWPFFAEFAAEILQEDADGLRFDIAWPMPGYVEKLRAALPGEVNFLSEDSAIVAPASLCARPSPFADRDLLARSVAQLESAAKRVAGVNMVPLRLENLLHIHKERPSADHAARLLGMSRRTLARRLAEHGLSYRSLLERVLKQRADELANSSKVSRAELADALGYSEPTSLSRARRRWSNPPET